MNDPFAETSAKSQESAATRLFAKIRGSMNGATTTEDPGTPTHQRTDFPSIGGNAVPGHASAARSAHPRTVSEDIDDHMDGSVHQGADVCPSCGYVRMSSVYCSVSQLHHGTDLPSETPRKKKPSLFSRIRDSMSGLTPMGGGDETDGATGSPITNADAGDATVNGAGTVVIPSSPPQQGGIAGLFTKTKEEKQIADLLHAEEKTRKQIVEVVKLSAHEIDRQLTAIHKDIREVLRCQERARNVVAFEFKTEFDKIYVERKRDLEEFKKGFLLEVKLILKKDKERKKHTSEATEDTVVDAGADEQQAAPAENVAKTASEEAP